MEATTNTTPAMTTTLPNKTSRRFCFNQSTAASTAVNFWGWSFSSSWQSR